jgi:hypothetical protein
MAVDLFVTPPSISKRRLSDDSFTRANKRPRAGSDASHKYSVTTDNIANLFIAYKRREFRFRDLNIFEKATLKNRIENMTSEDVCQVRRQMCTTSA